MYSNSCLSKMKMIFMQYLFSLKLVLFYVLPSNNNNNNNRLEFSWGNHNLSILVFLIDTISIKMWQRLLDRPSFGHWRRRAPTIFYYQCITKTRAFWTKKKKNSGTGRIFGGIIIKSLLSHVKLQIISLPYIKWAIPMISITK